MSNQTQELLLPAADNATRIMGRHIINEETGAIVVDWPGVRLDFTGISGTSFIQLRMNENSSVFGYRLVAEEDTSKSEEDPNAVNDDDDDGDDDDDDDFFTVVTGNTRKSYPLVLLNGSTQLDPSKRYKVSIWKRDGPMNNGATIFGLVVGSNGKGVQLKKEEIEHDSNKKQRRLIEFVGDSDTVGFGNQGEKSSIWFFMLFQAGLFPCFPHLRKATNVTKSWAHMVASRLHADYHIIAWEGAGAKYSKDIPDNMIDMYNRKLASDNKTGVDMKHAADLGPTPDAVVIYLGQNDEHHLEHQARVDEKLEEAFMTLLSKIRSYRPSPIPIVIVVPAADAKLSCVTDEKKCRKIAKKQKNVWESAVDKYVNLQGESDHFMFVIENNHSPNDVVLDSYNDYGMSLHWNVRSHEKWAAGLEPKLQQVLKWE